jgi:hypothetical protein
MFTFLFKKRKEGEAKEQPLYCSFCPSDVIVGSLKTSLAQ